VAANPSSIAPALAIMNRNPAAAIAACPVNHVMAIRL
jgi:hypothetical protein